MTTTKQLNNTLLVDDTKIRVALRKTFASYQDTRILEEFLLMTDPVRVDMVLVNKRTVGIEIKSDFDSLKRLPHQIKGYDKIFDLNYLVVGNKLLSSAMKLLPSHWGVILAQADKNGRTILKHVRFAKNNPNIDLASLLFTMPVINLKKELLPLLPEDDRKLGRTMIKQNLIKLIVKNANGIGVDQVESIIVKSIKN
ncbi:hypothetical protein ESZ50_00780 [Weissella muntiaci]|uniref:Sce7726 family protein n=1 Tax=Weissella muntiaci TaxID=2508881 RepID=A0A6C2CBV8_9LACO|nr:sce7726 family protein [Weissella muntiaci]TYC51102.1 hypothetical protein ESZ50_00780 [Weissella muntiaci]